MWYVCDSSVMPRNIAIDNTAIVSIVFAAFFDSGGLNAGTPFDTASTPVIAVQPFENAVSSRKSAKGCVPDSGGVPADIGCTVPVTTRQTPTPIRLRIVTMKK